jgi:CheY-like chemotaxis protein
VKRLILLADDSLTIQRLVTQTFADGQFDVVTVSNGDAAVKKFEEIRPDLVLADIYMPGKNGYEVCALIKKHPELSDTPVVLLAGAFDAFDDETASQVGAAAHITKPFEPSALVNLVTSLAPKSGRARSAGATSTSAGPAQPVPPSEPFHPLTVAPVTAVKEPAPPSVSPQPVASPQTYRAAIAEADNGDLLGLQELFKPVPPPPVVVSVSEEEIERIADRVIKKLSRQVIESVAWDVVPEITTKVLQEELKRQS